MPRPRPHRVQTQLVAQQALVLQLQPRDLVCAQLASRPLPCRIFSVSVSMELSASFVALMFLFSTAISSGNAASPGHFYSSSVGETPTTMEPSRLQEKSRSSAIITWYTASECSVHS